MIIPARFVKFQPFAAFGLIVIVMWAAIAFALQGIHDREIDKAFTNGRNLARSLAKYEEGRVAAIDRSLLDLRTLWIGDRGAFALMVQHHKSYLASQGAIQTSVQDADGWLVFSELPEQRRLNFSDREYFKVQKELGTDELVISEPVLGRVTKQWAIQYTRPIRDRHGQFAGLIIHTVLPPALEKVFKDVDLGDGGVALVRSDGTFLARSEGLASAASIRLSPLDTPGLNPSDPDCGEFRRASTVGGVDSLVAYCKVTSRPFMTVFVRQPVSTVLAPYYAQRTTYVVSGVVVTVLLWALALLLISGRRDKARAERDRTWLAAIVEHTSNAVIGRAIDGTIISWNAAAERILGYTAAEVIGTDLTTISSPDLRQKSLANRELAQAGKSAPGWETEHITKDGRRIDVEANVSPIKDSDGHVIGSATILRDITERKRVQRELQHKTELAQLLEQLARATNEAVSPEAAMEFCLRRICEDGKWTLGRVASFQTAEPLSKTASSNWFCTEPARFDTFMHYSDRFVFDSATGKFIGFVLREQRPVWLPDVTAIDTATRLTMAADAGLKAAFAFPVIVRGKVVAVLELFATEAREPDALLIDGTYGLASQFARMIERARAEETRAMLAAIVENSNDGIISRTRDGTITSWNAAAERIFGYTAAEVIGTDVTRTFPPDVWQQALEARELARAGISVPNWEAVRITKDGRRIDVALSVSPVIDNSGSIIGTSTIIRDITERKAAELRLRDYSERKQADQTARDRERLLGTILDAVPAVVGYVDPEQRYRFVNRAFEEQIGIPRAEILGKTVREIRGDAAYRKRQPDIEAALAGRSVTNQVYVDYPHIGRRYVVLVHIPDFGPNGTVKGFYVVSNDITEEKERHERELEKERTLRDSLVREVHHRVKNALLGAILLLRDSRQNHPDLAAVIDPAIARLYAMAAVFGMQAAEGVQGVLFCKLVQEICVALARAMECPVEPVINTDVVSSIQIAESEAVPIALVVNELVFNAIKHGRPNAPVKVSLSGDVASASVRIVTPGATLPPGFDFEAGAGTGTGLQLVKSMLTKESSRVAITSSAEGVVAELVLRPPAIIEGTDHVLCYTSSPVPML